jgi:hypothetical protein
MEMLPSFLASGHTYQFPHVGGGGLRTWTSLGLKALRNFTSVIVVRFQNCHNVGIGHDRTGWVGRSASCSPSSVLGKGKVAVIIILVA